MDLIALKTSEKVTTTYISIVGSQKINEPNEEYGL